MQRQNDELDNFDEETEVATGYRSLGEWDDSDDERDEIAAFDDDDDPSRRRDPLRKH